MLVSGTWLDGVIVGAEGLAVVLDDGAGGQALVRLESILAVRFSRAEIDGEAFAGAREAWGGDRQPIEPGPVGG